MAVAQCSDEIFPIYHTTKFCCSHKHQIQLVWIILKLIYILLVPMLVNVTIQRNSRPIHYFVDAFWMRKQWQIFLRWSKWIKARLFEQSKFTIQLDKTALLTVEVFLKNGPFPASFFFIFVFSIHSWQLTIVQYINKFLPMTGFEPPTSGIGSDRSTNWATTTAIELWRYSCTD